MRLEEVACQFGGRRRPDDTGARLLKPFAGVAREEVIILDNEDRLARQRPLTCQSAASFRTPSVWRTLLPLLSGNSMVAFRPPLPNSILLDPPSS